MTKERVNSKLIQLTLTYKKTFPQKQESIIQAWDVLKTDYSNEEKYNHLHDAVHKLAGSAGMYGFESIFERAADVEKRLESFKQDPGQLSKVQASLDLLLEELTKESADL